MANVGLAPFEFESEDDGVFLTFILGGGCNLSCSFCIIDQRDEIIGNALSVDHIIEFLASIKKSAKVLAVSIQGHEPLTEGALPYTEAILRTCAAYGVPVALVTNGVLLARAAPSLLSTPPTKIAVSLNSAVDIIHDRIRGVVGSWTATLEGIRVAKVVLGKWTNIAINSVLLPSDRGQLQRMPEVLFALGVTEWIVTPLQQIGKLSPGGPVGNVKSIYGNLLSLQNAAVDAGIEMVVDDELGKLHYEQFCEKRPELRKIHVRTLPIGVKLIRLTPNGYCSVGRDILRKVTAETPRWNSGGRRCRRIH